MLSLVSYDFSDGFNHNARSIGITHLMNNTVLTADGTKIPVGKCDGITLRRGIVSIYGYTIVLCVILSIYSMVI